MLNLVQFCWQIAPTSLQHLRLCYIWLCINRAIPLPSSNSTTSSSKRLGSQLEYCPKHLPSMTVERLEHLILVRGHGFKSRNFRYDKLIAYLAAGSIEIDIQTSTLYRTLYESFSDVGEIRVWFTSKILTPCRMH